MSDFHRRLEEEIPRLRRYARALARNASRADDLVQETLTRAVQKAHLWQPGTDFRLAFYDHAQPERKCGPARYPRQLNRRFGRLFSDPRRDNRSYGVTSVARVGTRTQGAAGGVAAG